MHINLTKNLAIVIVFSSLLIVAAILFLANINKGFPYRDSGVFLYFGQQILQGQIPYRDIWDHKPPLIYFLNALGLIAGKGEIAGVWFLEFIFFSANAFLSFFTIKKIWGTVWAIAITPALLTTLALSLEGGNLTEEYSVTFILLSLYLFISNMYESTTSYIKNFFLGTLFALVFFLKPNATAFFLALLLTYFFQFIVGKRAILIKQVFIPYILGLLFIIIPLFSYFTFHQSLSNFLDSIFRFNFIYSTLSHTNRLSIIIQGIKSPALNQLTPLAIIGWLMVGVKLINERKLVSSPLYLFLLIWLPLEVIFITVSGKPDLHYFMVWIPALAFYSVFLLHNLSQKINIYKLILILGAVSILSFSVYKTVYMSWLILQRPTPPTSSLVNYLKMQTDPDEYILMWGAETTINFLSQRKSPVKYIYQYPLYIPGYGNKNNRQEFFQDLQQKKPRIIVDNQVGDDFVPDLYCGNDNPSIWYLPQNLPMKKTRDFICQNYSLQTIIDKQWLIYKIN